MRPAPFTFVRPTTLDDALAAIADGAVPIAGGQSLLQAMRLRSAAPGALVDITALDELSDMLEWTPHCLRIGALVTHADIATNQQLASEMPWLGESARRLGDVQVRNTGTVLGNVCWADPRANLAVALLASQASVVAVDRHLRRESIRLEHFFTGMRINSLGPRLAVAIEIPRVTEVVGTYTEFSRQAQDLALVNVAAVKAVGALAIAVGGIDPTPVRLPTIELVATTGGANALAAALEDELTTFKHAPVEDAYGSATYKLGLAKTLIRRALVHCGAG